MDVEHLWFSSQPHEGTSHEDLDESMVQTLAEMADKRLYKLVKWCKSLPLFKNILVSLMNKCKRFSPFHHFKMFILD